MTTTLRLSISTKWEISKHEESPRPRYTRFWSIKYASRLAIKPYSTLSEIRNLEKYRAKTRVLDFGMGKNVCNTRIGKRWIFSPLDDVKMVTQYQYFVYVEIISAAKRRS